MTTKYHSTIQQALVEFGKSHKGIKKVFEGNKVPLSIVESSSKLVVNYQPDVYYICKNRQKIIFEILESELKKQDIIIADITRSCLIDNCKGIVFIHPSKKEEDDRRVLEALKTVVKGMNNKGVSIDELPQKNFVYCIPKENCKNPKDIQKKLVEFSKKDKW